MDSPDKHNKIHYFFISSTAKYYKVIKKAWNNGETVAELQRYMKMYVVSAFKKI